MNALHLVTDTATRDLTPGHREDQFSASASMMLTWYLVRPMTFPHPTRSAERAGAVVSAGDRAGWADSTPWGHEALMWWAASAPEEATDHRISVAVGAGDGLIYHGLLAGFLAPTILDGNLGAITTGNDEGETTGNLWRLYADGAFSDPLHATPLRQIVAAKDAAAGLRRVRKGRRRVYRSPWPTLAPADAEWAHAACATAVGRLSELCSMIDGPEAMPRRWLAQAARVAFT